MKITVDGNYSASLMMHKLTEFASIYPITPSSPMAENYEKLCSDKKENIFGVVPKCVEMQSEAGVAGALHGALLSGAISTTFTSSQGLLLMIPNMYKIAGELLPCVINVSARSLATHALNIFCDHSDVMAVRDTGFAMLCASNVQECYDFALISYIASFNSSIPFVHFFDGFRTSHEIAKIETIDDEMIKSILPYGKIEEFKKRALSPFHPIAVGTNQNPDVFFQNREASAENYSIVAKCVKEAMDAVYQTTKRKYNLFDYVGNENAEYLIIAMGSSAESIEEFIIENEISNVGVLKIRLFRPFDISSFVDALPKTIKKICVLDRVKDATANCDMLATEVINALYENEKNIKVICGRYGLGGKDFTTGMIKSVIDNLQAMNSKNHFLIGINDDLMQKSLNFEKLAECNHYSALFYGLGSDGTVSANKNSIKIIGDNSNKYVQGYFEYDSKKSGSMTISHLRISEKEIKSHYLVNSANFIAVHNFNFLSKINLIDKIKEGATILLNSNYVGDELLAHLPNDLLQAIAEKHCNLYFINANKYAYDLGLKNKINIVMQASFFKTSKLLDEKICKNEMIQAIKYSYGKKGESIVNANIEAINAGFDCVKQINFQKICEYISKNKTQAQEIENSISDEYYNTFIKPITNGAGNDLKVSDFNKYGAVKTGTTKFEKRKIANTLPDWIPENCIECNMCAISCPHGCIRPKLMEKGICKPENLKCKDFNKNSKYDYKIQIKPFDCTGCGVCANVCPAKNKALKMVITDEIFENEVKNDEFIENLPQIDSEIDKFSVIGSQFEPTLFEFSGACAGCGETPYIKLLTQLYGDKMIIANATGCSSIYGGSCPTCPYTTNDKGCGPVFANSLFEDNAEFGLGLHYGNIINNKDDIVWIIGGDGWAYDIGFGGLDHILASGENVNILVLDTEVYSNTGGQMSKSTPRGSTAQFASDGKSGAKKRLASVALNYGNVYVAQISLGANMNQAIKAFKEAVEYNGVSLIIAYCPCINHGIDMSKSNEEMKLAVQSGYFDLFRFNPSAENQLSIDSKPSKNYEDFVQNENRYKLLKRKNENEFNTKIQQAKNDAESFRNYLNSLKKD